MTWSYASTAPSATDKDWIRWRTGLTDSTDQLQTDEEISAALATYGSKFKAASATARAVAAKFSRRADTTMGQLRVMHSQKAEHYNALADAIEAGVALDAGRVASIAISRSDRETETDNTDRPDPSFTHRMFTDVERTLQIDWNTTSS